MRTTLSRTPIVTCFFERNDVTNDSDSSSSSSSSSSSNQEQCDPCIIKAINIHESISEATPIFETLPVSTRHGDAKADQQSLDNETPILFDNNLPKTTTITVNAINNNTCVTTRDIFLSPTERFIVWQVKVAERPDLVPVYCSNDGSNNGKSLYGDTNNSNGENMDLNEITKETTVCTNDYYSDYCTADVCNNTNQSETIDDDAVTTSSSQQLQALTDGCDLPTWRQYGLVKIDSEAEAILQIGSGCTLLRRESQLVPFKDVALYVDNNSVPKNSNSKDWYNLRQRLLQEPLNSCQRLHMNDHDSLLKKLHPWFERDNVPVIIEGATDDWKAMKTCTFEALLHRKFVDCNDDDDDDDNPDSFDNDTTRDVFEWRFSDLHSETMTLHTYNKYIYSIEGLTDDAPLAIYDSQFANDKRRVLLQEYNVPSCFDSDLFECLEESTPIPTDDIVSNVDDDDSSSFNTCMRPPYRWILIGPPRSGTGLHIDPVGTHAWVALVQGLKRWVLFPPDTNKEEIGMNKKDNVDANIPSVVWFRDWYPKVMPNHPRAIEILQQPGETVYVPAHWPHVVLNLELSVAITHNYASEYPSIDRLIESVQQQEPEMAKKLIPLLSSRGYKCTNLRFLN